MRVNLRIFSNLVALWSVTFLTRAVSRVSSIAVEDEKITGFQCFNINENRNCIFMSVNWNSELTYAQQFCVAHDGTLITIDSQQKQELIEAYVQDVKTGWYLRTGARFQINSEGWFWSKLFQKVEDKDVSNQTAASAYRTQAAIVQGKKDKRGYSFVARHPTDNLPFICQYPVESNACGNKISDFRIGGQCFVVNTAVHLTWHKARNKCLMNGGDLAVFNNLDGIPDIHPDLSSPHWVLLRNSFWYWTDGNEMLYSNWGTGQPTDIDKSCMVLDYRDPWKWTTYDCVDKLRFICQQNSAVSSGCGVKCIYIVMLLIVIIMIYVQFRRNLRKRKINGLL